MSGIVRVDIAPWSTKTNGKNRPRNLRQKRIREDNIKDTNTKL